MGVMGKSAFSNSEEVPQRQKNTMSHHAGAPVHPRLVTILKRQAFWGTIGTVVCGVVVYFGIDRYHQQRDAGQRLMRQRQAEREEGRSHLPATGQLDDIKADFEALGFDPERLPSYVLDKA